MERTEYKKTAYKEKIREFFKGNYPLFLAPLLVAVLYAIGLAYYGVYPFGNKYTGASYDLSAQICPFIEHFFDVFKGRSTLSFTYSLVGGMDVVGSLLYCAVSPFTPLFFVFGEGKVLYASSIVMLCKLATIAFSGTWFAKKMFQGIPDYICIGVGVLYAYCGYAFLSSTYINWMDFLIYGPFCVWAFRYFVKTGKFLPFSILLACGIYTCFSIASFSLFIVFPVLIFYGMFCVEQEKRARFIATLCLSFAVAVGISAPVLLPAFSSYLDGGRGGGLFEKLFQGFELDEFGFPKDFVADKVITAWTDALYYKFSYILSDSIFVILTLGYFIRKGLRSKLSVFMLFAGILTLLPVLIDESMLLLNMGSYMSYALRFGFLNALYFLSGACLFLQDICYQKGCAFDGGGLRNFVKKKKVQEIDEDLPTDTPIERAIPLTRTKAWNTVAILFGVLGGVLLLIFTLFSTWVVGCVQDGSYQEKVKTASAFIKTVMQTVKDFSAPFAHSLGGLEIVATFFCVVAVVAVILLSFVANKRISPRLCVWVLLPMLAVQVGFYNQHLVVGNRSEQHINANTYAQLVSVLDEKENGAHYRLFDYDQRMSADAPLFADANAFTVFSSMTDKDAFITWEMFGFRGTGKNSYKSGFSTGKSNHGKELAFSFLGYKYFFVPSNKRDEVKKWKQLKQLTVLDENGKEQPLSSGGFYIYENTAVFPLAYKVDRGDFRFAYPNIANADNRKGNHLALYEFLRGESIQSTTGQTEINYTSVSALSEYLWTKSADIEVGAGRITAKVSSAKKGECLMLNFASSEGYSVKVNGKKAKLIDNDLNFLSVALEEGENTIEFSYRSPYGKYFWIGSGIAVISLAFAVLLGKVQGKAEKAERVVYSLLTVAGILLAVAVIGFFMIFPMEIGVYKSLCLLKDAIGKWITSLLK